MQVRSTTRKIVWSLGVVVALGRPCVSEAVNFLKPFKAGKAAKTDKNCGGVCLNTGWGDFVMAYHGTHRAMVATATQTRGLGKRIVDGVKTLDKFLGMTGDFFPGDNTVNLARFQDSQEVMERNRIVVDTFNPNKSKWTGVRGIFVGDQVLLVIKMGEEIGHPVNKLGVIGYVNPSDLAQGDHTKVPFRPITDKTEQDQIANMVRTHLSGEVQKSWFQKKIPVIFKSDTAKGRKPKSPAPEVLPKGHPIRPSAIQVLPPGFVIEK